MKEEEYIDSFKKETDSLHAPADLIALTKKRTATEQLRLQAEKKRKKKLYYFITAAAALLFLCVVTVPLWNINQAGTENNLYLGSYETEQDSKEGIAVEKVAILPMDFAGTEVETVEINGIEILLTTDGNGGYMAAYKENDSMDNHYVLISSDEKDKDIFLEFLGRTIK
ncbi:MAG: hypothetical protein ACI4TB_01200 [Lachnospiraceae bacterium]